MSPTHIKHKHYVIRASTLWLTIQPCILVTTTSSWGFVDWWNSGFEAWDDFRCAFGTSRGRQLFHHRCLGFEYRYDLIWLFGLLWLFIRHLRGWDVIVSVSRESWHGKWFLFMRLRARDVDRLWLIQLGRLCITWIAHFRTFAVQV